MRMEDRNMSGHCSTAKNCMVESTKASGMRILILNWRDIKHTWAGGGELYIFEQASRWVKAGHEVQLFCGQDIDKQLPSYEVLRGIKVHRKGGRYSVYLWAMWYYFTYFRGKVDLVVDVGNGIPFFTPLYCTVPKVCYVYHVHGRQFFYELSKPLSFIGYGIERYIFPFLYRHVPTIAISDTTKKQLINIGIPEQNISIVYCGMNGASEKINSLHKKFSHPTILYLGRIKKYKRIDLLISIFDKILTKVPRARLIIAGWGTDASNLTDIVMKSPLRRKISLVGPVSTQEKRALLSKSWIFVNPSIGEGWSIAVIEANLYGTPAIAFNVPGLAESIRSGKTGLLVKNEHELIFKICKVLKSKSIREKLSNHASKWARSFSWERSAKESLHILERVVRK